MNISLLVDYEEWKFKECGMTLHHIGRLIMSVVRRMHGNTVKTTSYKVLTFNYRCLGQKP